MDESRGVGRGAAAASVLLLSLLAWLGVRRPLPEPFANAPVAATSPRPAGTLVHAWLSTADRRLRLAEQPDTYAGERDAGADAPDVVVDLAHAYQTMDGFGAALTDSSAWLIRNRMGQSQRTALLQELFGPPPGLDFNLLRITIGASDFSLQHYTLDDMPAGETDPQLQHFNIAAEQRDLIPVLRTILAIHPGVRIIASPWSAPAWMKTSANLISGTLLEQYESVYADYLVHFVDAFENAGIPIYALTVQNEPNFEPLTYPGMLLSAEARAHIIGQYLGPALARRDTATLILGWDHNWDEPDQSLDVLADPDALRYVDGIAWHCYRGDASAQTRVHRDFPRKSVYLTECSGGDWASARNGELLLFARNIVMASIRNWAGGVLYWNLALDENHGPHAGGCDLCKGVVTIDSKTGEVSRNDEYYAFAHFSRFVRPGAVRVKSSGTAEGIHEVAFRNPDQGSVVLVVVNGKAQAHYLTVAQGDLRFGYELPPTSVATFTWVPDTQAVPASAASAAPPAASASAARPGAVP